jgi:hypothetical protein
LLVCYILGDIGEELQIIDINSRIVVRLSNKWVQHLERMEQNTISKLLLNYKPRGRRDQGRPCRRWKDSFKIFIGFNFKQLLKEILKPEQAFKNPNPCR